MNTMNTELEFLERELSQVLADLSALTVKVQTIAQRVSELRTVETPSAPVDPDEIDLEPVALSPEEMRFAYGPAESDPEGDVEQEVTEAEHTQQIEDDTESASEVTTECHPVILTVNDRYRFLREIFNGDDAAMKDALDVISVLPDMEAIEAYLTKSLLTPESEIYPEFLAAIRLSR